MLLCRVCEERLREIGLQGQPTSRVEDRIGVRWTVYLEWPRHCTNKRGGGGGKEKLNTQ